MSDERPGAQGPEEQVGSVADEAAKLFAALSGFAREHAGEYAGAASQAAAAFRDSHEHLATGAPECTWCPLCQVVRAVRSTSPEVRAHLTAAASSLVQAAAGVLATQVPTDRNDSAVQKIDLDDDGGS